MTNLQTLFDSAAAGDLEILTQALEANPELAQAVNEGGINLLMWAMYNRQTEAANLIYKHLDNPSAEQAVAVNDIEALKTALANNSDPNNPELISAYSNDGFTLLHYACFFAHPDCVKYLLQQHAEVNSAAQNPSKVYPIHSAAAAQSVVIVDLLLTAGANPNVQQSGGFTPLMSAAVHNNAELITLLLANGADKAQTDDEGKTAWDHGESKGFEISVLKI